MIIRIKDTEKRDWFKTVKNGFWSFTFIKFANLSMMPKLPKIAMVNAMMS